MHLYVKILAKINVIYLLFICLRLLPGAPPLFSEANVRLKVVDRSQPIFSQQFYNADIAESADLHAPVLTVAAHSQLNRDILYAIVRGTNHLSFGIEHEEGELGTCFTNSIS